MSGDRHRPANRREAQVYDFQFAGIRYCGKVSRDRETGAVLEIFLDAVSVKSTSPLAHVSHSLAVTASLALQYGCPADVLAHALPRVSLPDGSSQLADPLGELLCRIIAAEDSDQPKPAA